MSDPSSEVVEAVLAETAAAEPLPIPLVDEVQPPRDDPAAQPEAPAPDDALARTARIADLMRALEAGGYNAAPSELKQGCDCFQVEVEEDPRSTP